MCIEVYIERDIFFNIISWIDIEIITIHLKYYFYVYRVECKERSLHCKKKNKNL